MLVLDHALPVPGFPGIREIVEPSIFSIVGIGGAVGVNVHARVKEKSRAAGHLPNGDVMNGYIITRIFKVKEHGTGAVGGALLQRCRAHWSNLTASCGRG